MKNVSLLFGVHMHQPIDNFRECIDEAVELCYKPFFETMAKYPQFKFSLHSSGWLLEQIQTRYPKLFTLMQELTSKGSIEWLSAGYYEPVLSCIPSVDRVHQIKKLNSYIKKHFKTSPKGLWLTERVWEASLIPDLVECGIKYVVVDDYHFLSSGFESRELDGYYMTEESAKEIGLFPIAKPLRYALPFSNVHKAIDTVLEYAKEQDSAAIVFDDAEKFGLWPKTHAWVYKEGWLEKFVQAVLQNEAVTTEHYAEYMQQKASKGLAYLNNASYFEMGEWSLKPKHSLALEALKEDVGEEYFNDVGISFIKGGIWKNFFIKYHESNYLHKRMLYWSKKQEELSKNARESLYKLQTNDVFWHGVFGGIYLPNLRDNAYRYLLEIEKANAKKEITYDLLDIDMDGYEELKVQTPNLSLLFSTKNGGQMVEFGAFDALFNWQNTLMRRYESYHEKLVSADSTVKANEVNEEDGIATIHNDEFIADDELKSLLLYDWYPKNSFVDHIAPEEFTLHNFERMTFNDVGDFANQPFVFDKKNIRFTRKGGIYLDRCYDTKIKKSYSFARNTFGVKLAVNSSYEGKLYYGQEFNLHFAHPHKVRFNAKSVEDGFSEYECRELVITDDFTRKKIIIKTDAACSVHAHILNTVSKSELGFDKSAQQISFILALPFYGKLEFQVDLELCDV